jgi:hypothetical protein
VTEQVVTNTRVMQLSIFTQQSHLAHWVVTLPGPNHCKQHSCSAIGWRSVWISLWTFWCTYVGVSNFQLALMFVAPYILVTYMFDSSPIGCTSYTSMLLTL